MRMRMVFVGFVLMSVAGCESTRVSWRALEAAPADTLGVLGLTDDGLLAFSTPLSAAVSPLDTALCAGSLAVARESDRWYAAWLSRRSDSTVAVVSSRSVGGRQWASPAMVDSVDVGKVGCRRPPPSIAVAGGYVHIAYSLKAPEGYGVFFAHSMDQARSFHSPMIVVYGDRLSATATAAHGMRVAIAYEDPSGRAKRIDVALSNTQGHTFEPRERGSPDEMAAAEPRIAIRDSTVALSFVGADGVSRAVRIGHIP